MVVVVSWFIAFPMIDFSINLSKIRLSLQSKHISTEWKRDHVPMFALRSATFLPAIRMYLALKPQNFIDSISSDWRNETPCIQCTTHAIPTILYQGVISSILNVNTIKWLYLIALANATRDRDRKTHEHTQTQRVRDTFRLWHFIITHQHRHRQLTKRRSTHSSSSPPQHQILQNRIEAKHTKKLINSISFVYVNESKRDCVCVCVSKFCLCLGE